MTVEKTYRASSRAEYDRLIQLRDEIYHFDFTMPGLKFEHPAVFNIIPPPKIRRGKPKA